MSDVQVSDGSVRLAPEADTETIRIATVADREAIRRLVNQAFVAERALKKGGLDRLPVGDGELDRLLEHGTFLLLEEAGAIVACVYVEPRSERVFASSQYSGDSRSVAFLNGKATRNTGAVPFTYSENALAAP